MGSLIKKLGVVFVLWFGISCGDSVVEVPQREACEIDHNVINEGLVDLKVEFELPAALSSDCSAAQPNNLQAYILIPSAEICDLTLSGSSLSGCCPDIENAANQMLSLTLVYRDLASQKALAEQLKNQFLKTTSLRTVEVSFADEDVDTTYYPVDLPGDYLTQWCAGTL